jgi:hypothetical protein
MTMMSVLVITSHSIITVAAVGTTVASVALQDAHCTVSLVDPMLRIRPATDGSVAPSAITPLSELCAK